MSRGLGKVQRDILTELGKTDGGMWVYGLACRVYQRDDPPRAFVESVRRAVRMLVDRGLLCCETITVGTVPLWTMTGPYCWLPEHSPPDRSTRVRRLRGKEIEQAVIEFLQSQQDGRDTTQHITRRLGATFGQHQGQAENLTYGHFAVAVHRAIHRLIERRQIVIAGRTPFGKVNEVKLSVAV